MSKPALNFSFIPFIASQIKWKLFYICICWFLILFIKIFQYLILFWSNLFCILKNRYFPVHAFRKFNLYIENTCRPFAKSFFKNKSCYQHKNGIKWNSIKISSPGDLISLGCEIFQIWPLDAGFAIDCSGEPHIWRPKIHSEVFLKSRDFEKALESNVCNLGLIR